MQMHIIFNLLIMNHNQPFLSNALNSVAYCLELVSVLVMQHISNVTVYLLKTLKKIIFK